MTENDRDLHDRIHEYIYPYTLWGSLLVMSKLPNFVLGRYGIVLDVRYLFLGIIWVSSSVSSRVSWVPSWVPLHHFSLPQLYLTLNLTLPILNLTLLHLNLTLLYLNLTFPILTSHCLILNLTLNLTFSILLFFFDH